MSEEKILRHLDALQTQYVRALDLRDMDGWVSCFDAESSYVCIARENVEQQLPLALMMDDNLARIRDRASYVTKVWSDTFEDYATRHFLQRLGHWEIGPGLYKVESNVMVTYTSTKGHTEVLIAGLYEDLVVLDTGVPRFRSKRVVIDTTATPRYLVYPV